MLQNIFNIISIISYIYNEQVHIEIGSLYSILWCDGNVSSLVMEVCMENCIITVIFYDQRRRCV